MYGLFNIFKYKKGINTLEIESHYSSSLKRGESAAHNNNTSETTAWSTDHYCDEK